MRSTNEPESEVLETVCRVVVVTTHGKDVDYREDLRLIGADGEKVRDAATRIAQIASVENKTMAVVQTREAGGERLGWEDKLRWSDEVRERWGDPSHFVRGWPVYDSDVNPQDI